ncbi:MAG: hypothetical protein ACR2O6_09615 [Ilumatobacteraceae bacterium]
MHPAFGAGSATEAFDVAEEADDDVLVRLWTNVGELRTIRERELDVVAPLTAIAGEERTATLPLLDRDVHDLDGLWTIADHLFES